MKKNYASPSPTLLINLLLFFLISTQAFPQKVKDIEPVLICVKDLSNGLYQASFGYYNPTNKEVIIDESASIIKSNNGKKLAKGLNKFKPGSVDKVFTKEFGPKDYVEWTIISNGNTHTVYANANSAKCSEDDGFVFPVTGNNGKSYDLIGQELSSLCDNVAGETPSELIFQVSAGKVLVEIVPKASQMAAVLSLLQGAPFNIPVSDFLLDLSQYNDLAAIDVYFNPQALCALNGYGNIINFARPVYPAYNNSGGVSSQGDNAQQSNLVRESFRLVKSDGNIVAVDGTGIKVGVLSDSYDMALGVPGYAALDIANGELPENVEVLKDNVYKSTDEGRAMMQIIHDVAPGASLAFHTATASPRQFEVGFNALKDAGCDIIVDDITFITEPFFGIGRISESVQSYVNQTGKFHYTSAGNIANKGYQATFNTSSSLPITNFIPSGSPTRAHVFGTNPDGSQDYLQKISVVPGTYLIVLQWKEFAASQENIAGATNDLDIYVVDDSGRLLVGNNRVNVNGDPTEIIVFKSTGTGDANIIITSANGSTNVPFRYIAFRTNAEDSTPNGLKFPEYFGDGAPTVSGHAMTPESVTVGAVDYRNALNPVAEAFSSYAGLLKDGTNLDIDIYAPDGGNTASTTIGQLATDCLNCDNDGFLNFYGTSAAAPHAAAAMALLKSALPYWYPNGSGATTFTSIESLETFKNTSINFTARDGSTGQFINTLNAFKSIASQTAKITSLTILSGTASVEPITVSIIGEFFPSKDTDPYPAKVYFDGQELTDIEVVSDTEIIATIPAFTGNPDLTIYTEPKPGTEGNGGFSDPVKILPEGKYAINIVPNNAVFEYGQDISLSYFVQGLPPEDLDPSLSYSEIMASLGFPEVKLNSGADAKLAVGDYPIVFDYVITPSFAEALSQELLDKYQVNFISGYIDADPEIGKVGYLTITKKDLTIIPPDVTYTYGDPVDFAFNYNFNATGMSDEDGFRLLINHMHANDFKDGIQNKFTALVSKFTALVSDYDMSFLNGGSWSATERTIQNKFTALVSGMNVIKIDNENFTDYISAREDYDDGTTNKFTALVSKFTALVSAEDLFAGNVELGIENKFTALVSKFTALVSSDDPDRPFKEYSEVFTIVNGEDAAPDDGSDDERAISDIYALNMLTGIDVTSSEEDRHYIYPGAFLNEMSANFNITYGVGQIRIDPKDLNVKTTSFTVPFGEVITLSKLLGLTTFEGWAFEGDAQESIETVFPEGVPFYFVKEGVDYELFELKAIGDYEIKIRNPHNYIINSTYNDNYGILTITPAILNVTISPDDAIVSQGAIPDLSFEFGPFAYDENETTVFPDGIPYYFVDEYGDAYYNTDSPGAYYVKLDDPENYTIVYNEVYLFINPADQNAKKVRSYADCVSYDPDAPDGLFYTAVYRYENDNDYPVYVNEGPDNFLTGIAFNGQLPTVFMPGSGTFEIKFDGNQLVWSLTTFDGTHKSSISSASTSESGTCDAKLDGAYSIYPNPVIATLSIKQNIMETGAHVKVFDMYGYMKIDAGSFSVSLSTIDINMSQLVTGLYVVRITSDTDVRTYNILKE